MAAAFRHVMKKVGVGQPMMPVMVLTREQKFKISEAKREAERVRREQKWKLSQSLR